MGTGCLFQFTYCAMCIYLYFATGTIACDHYARECEFGILKGKNKTKKQEKSFGCVLTKNSSVVWKLTTEGERPFHCGIVRGGGMSSSGHRRMSGIYNIGHCVIPW